jgi:sugar lactone lactonase YvrE
MKPIRLALVVAFVLTAPALAQDIPLSKILVEKEPWRPVAQDLPNVAYLEAEPTGSVVIYQAGRSARLSPAGKVEPGPALKGEPPSARSVATAMGARYLIDPAAAAVVAAVGTKRDMLKLPGLVAPACLVVWPDEGHLVIGESDGAYLWAVRIEADGALGPGDRYYSLRTRPGMKLPIGAMAMDAGFLLYACTPLGIQVVDPTGRLSGVIAPPTQAPITAITIGGAGSDQLIVAAGDRVFARRIQGKAIYTRKKG